MIGVILCGGKSTRMGMDKGLLLKENKTWTQIAFEKLGQLPLNCLLSVNESQRDLYCSLLSSYPFVFDKNELKAGGPLLGILSVHEQFPTEDLFVLACDMVNMESKILRELLTARMKFKDFQAYVFQGNDSIEPLCGIYTSGGLSKVFKALTEKAIPRHSMKYILNDILKTKYISLNEEWQKYFENFNSPEDFNRI